MVSLNGGSAFIKPPENADKSKLTSESHHKPYSALFKANIIIWTLKLSLWAALGRTQCLFSKISTVKQYSQYIGSLTGA